MHFSSPSGQRFSWWRPWNRGAVGFFSSGYSTVSTFLNICRKVTPKPLTGPRNSGTGDLLDGVGWGGTLIGTRLPGGDDHTDSVIVGRVQRRHREAGARAGRLAQPAGAWCAGSGTPGGFLRLLPGGGAAALGGHVHGPRQQQQDRKDRPADYVDRRAVAVLAAHADRRDHQDPGQRYGDEHLPPEPHQLVVPSPGQAPAQPDEAEQQDQHLGQEPQQRPPAGD